MHKNKYKTKRKYKKNRHSRKVIKRSGAKASLVVEKNNSGRIPTLYHKKSGGNHKESILIILSSDQMYPEFKPQIESLKKYIIHISKKYNVDIAAISSIDDFSNYSDILDFKYKYINKKKQVSKLCDFISENKDNLKYDWFFRTRPESEMVNFDTIDFTNLPKNAVSARAREYIGPFMGKHACSVGGEGEYINIKACHYKKDKEKLVIDDTIVFHRMVIDNGGFIPLSNEKEAEYIRQDEWFLTNMLVSRGIDLNIIDIDVKFTRASRGQTRMSGPVDK
jgi:hypothetical protein